MEESRSAETPNAAKMTQPSQDPLPKSSPPSTKRKLNDSSYFKICSLVRQLRPQFIQVLQTPDFRNCKAAHEIRTQTKHILDLYKQMTAEMEQHERALGDENVLGKQPLGGQQQENLSELLQHLKDSAEKKVKESFIVGGSAFGWNYITYFGGGKPAYYGVTKESFRINRK